MVFKKIKFLKIFFLFSFLTVFSANQITLKAQKNLEIMDSTKIKDEKILGTINKYKKRYKIRCKTCNIDKENKENYVIIDLKDKRSGFEYCFVVNDKNTKKKDGFVVPCSSYGYISFFSQNAKNDMGVGHSFEHVSADKMCSEFKKAFKNVSTDASFFNATTHDNYIDFYINSDYFNKDTIKIIFDNLLNPKFLEDKKLFEKQVLNLKNKKPSGRMYNEVLDKSQLYNGMYEVNQLKLSDMRTYDWCGRPKDILKLKQKYVKEFCKEYIKPYNMLVVAAIDADEMFKIDEIIKSCEENYIDKYLKKHPDESVDLKKPKYDTLTELKDNRKFVKTDLHKYHNIFKKSYILEKVPPKNDYDEEYFDDVISVDFNIRNLNLNADERDGFEFLKSKIAGKFLEEKFKNLGYEAVKVSLARKEEQHLNIYLVPKKSDLCKEETIREDCEKVFEGLFEKIDGLTKEKVLNLHKEKKLWEKDKGPHRYCIDTQKDLLSCLMKSRYTYGDVFSKQVINLNACDLEKRVENMALNLNKIKKLSVKNALIDHYHRDKNKVEKKYYGQYNMPIRIKKCKDKTTHLLAAEYLKENLDKYAGNEKGFMYGNILSPAYFRGCFQGVGNFDSQEVVTQNINKYLEKIKKINLTKDALEAKKDMLEALLDEIKKELDSYEEKIKNFKSIIEKLDKKAKNKGKKKFSEKEKKDLTDYYYEIVSIYNRLFSIKGQLLLNSLDEYRQYVEDERKNNSLFNKFGDYCTKFTKEYDFEKFLGFLKIFKKLYNRCSLNLKICLERHKEHMHNIDGVTKKDILDAFSSVEVIDFDKANPNNYDKSYYDGRENVIYKL